MKHLDQGITHHHQKKKYIIHLGGEIHSQKINDLEMTRQQRVADIPDL
jgi:hypothetical protein